jgi:hypothetical protein
LSAFWLTSYTFCFNTTLISPPSSSRARKAVPLAVGGRWAEMTAPCLALPVECLGLSLLIFLMAEPGVGAQT